MRLSFYTHFQYADSAPAVHVALPGDGRMPSRLPIVAFKRGLGHAFIGGPSHRYALARRSMR